MKRKPKRIKKKKSILKNRFFGILLLTIFLSGGTLYIVFFSKFFEINLVSAQGAESSLNNEVRAIIEQSLKKKFLFWRPENLLFINAHELQTLIQDQFPQIESVKVQRNFPDSVLVILRERVQAGLVCDEQNNCFIFDKTGVMFKQKKLEKEDFVVSAGSINNSFLSIGQTILQNEPLVALLDFRNKAEVLQNLSDVKITFISALIISNQRIEYKTSEGWDIYINPQNQLDWQATKLQTVLEKKVSIIQRPKLEYIDLRFGDQAYIKYR